MPQLYGLSGEEFKQYIDDLIENKFIKIYKADGIEYYLATYKGECSVEGDLKIGINGLQEQV